MHDIKMVRDDPERFDALLAVRGFPAKSAEVLALDEAWRASITRENELRSQKNALSTQIGINKRNGEDTTDLLHEVAEIARSEESAKATAASDEFVLATVLKTIPNIPQESVPPGRTEAENIFFSVSGSPRKDTTPPHEEIGRALGMLDAPTAVAMSGERFTMLTGGLAALERALGQFMINRAIENGFTEVSVPLIVNREALYGTGQLPKFADDLYAIEGETKYLIPTAEVPLTNIVRDRILDKLDQPLRYCALTPCFRSEAGSAGRDTAGLIRQHQFYKTELVTICQPDVSGDEHKKMLSAAESVLLALGLPYRVIELCSGDLGFSSSKTYDIEVWFPSQQRYREISSISNCLEFQARRMNARYRNAKGKPAFVHTLNGSGVAVGRALAAVMETYLNKDGSITIPDVLRSYMGGLKEISQRSATPDPVNIAALRGRSKA